MKKIFVFLTLAAFAFSSCEIINPEEEIPSYIRVDEAFIDILTPTQGTAVHSVSDCWLFVNGKSIGTFEIPFEVPVLASGKVKVEIEPGIMTSGQNASRSVYSMLTNYQVDTILTAGQTNVFAPHYQYRSGVEFVFVESFDEVGCKFETSDSSDYLFTLAAGQDGEGNAMRISIPHDDYTGIFECVTSDIYKLSKTGKNFIEVNYKSNDYFNFGMFAVVNELTSSQGVRGTFFTFYPTNGKWKTVYIDLNYAIINSSATDEEFQPFFTMLRQESLSPKDEDTEILIDNIKLLHLETEAK